MSPSVPGKITEDGSAENHLSIFSIMQNSLPVNDLDNIKNIIPVMIALDR
jgi:hypothetical protein